MIYWLGSSVWSSSLYTNDNICKLQTAELGCEDILSTIISCFPALFSLPAIYLLSSKTSFSFFYKSFPPITFFTYAITPCLDYV